MDPEEATFSKEAPEDVVFTVEWADGSTNCTMKLNGENVTKSGHWAYSEGTITFDKTYLATLDNGTYEFVATGNSGESEDVVTLKVTVGD